jgi:hypothetical protein
MEQSSSWEAKRSSATQEISCILWNLKVYYRIHKNLSQVLNLSNTVDYSFLILLSSGLLRCVSWFEMDVLGLSIGPNLKGQAS